MNWWPFKRRVRPAPVIKLPVEQTWRAGDIAECIRATWWPAILGRKPALGARTMVLSVDYDTFTGTRVQGLGLRLIGYEHWWDARAFRKIVLTDTGADRRVARKVPARVGERRPELVD